MQFIINTTIAGLIAALIVMGTLHFYPDYIPRDRRVWGVLAAFGLLTIAVAEALADSAGILPNWPKTLRFMLIIILCSLACMGALVWVANGGRF